MGEVDHSAETARTDSSEEERVMHPTLSDGIKVPSGVDGLDLVHFMSWTVDDGLPVDGSWSVTLSDRKIGVQRCPFRTLHAAAHYADRIREFADWTTADANLLKGATIPSLSNPVGHNGPA